MRYLTLLSLVFLLACGNRDQNSTSSSTQKDDYSSPKAQFVDYIHSYTGGVVSINSDIRLRLANPLTDSLIQTIDESLFEIDPEVNGEGFWENNSTYVFVPHESLKQNQQYKVAFNLKRVQTAIQKDKAEFRFTFQTLLQNFDVIFGGLKLYGEDPTKLRVEGQVQTADYAALENIKKVISAKQSNRDLVINWEPGKNNVYPFTIENVIKTKNESQVTISTDGSAIGVQKSEMIAVDIPSLDNYKVLSSRIIEQGEKYISVTFSDPIDPRQNLNGLVTVSGSDRNPRLVVNVNELKIYADRNNAASITLTIDESVRNAAGFELKEDYQVTLQFTQVKPEVRFTSKDNRAILPTTKGLTLPFEATGLNAVDVTVVRVFPDNVLQYLQVNRMGGTNQLRRVARPVVSKTIALNTSGVTNLNTWNRYELDLSETLTAEPGAIYQIKIGFRRQHSLYLCDTGDGIQPLDESMESWGTEDESSYWDDAEDYYYYDYNWEERDNPCSDSYYGSRRSISKVLFASDLGLIAKKRDNGDLSVFTTNLLTTEPVSGASLEVFDYQQQLIGTGNSDGEGMAILKTKGIPFALKASSGEQTAYLRLDDGSSLSLSNFDVSGTSVQQGLKGFLYGERGVWRPGDTLHIGFIIEDVEGKLPKNHPVILELDNPKGKLTYRQISSQPVGNIYRFDIITDKDDPTGNWQARGKVGGASFSKEVKIETIKPNRLKVNLEFTKDQFSASDREIYGDLNVRWLTGATASNLKATYDLKLTPVKTTFEGWGQYHFDDHSKSFYSERETVFEGRVNADGYARLSFSLDQDNHAPGALQANLYGKIFEEGGDFSVSNTSIPYYPYSGFVGMIVPEGDRRGMLLTDKDHTIQIATVDSEGRPVSRNNLSVKLYKMDWRWWWDTSYDNISNYVGRSYRSPIQTSTASTNNGKGEWVLQVKYPEWGRYYLQITDPTTGHSTGKVIYMDWPGWAGKAKRGELDGASMLDFAASQESYNVGETISLSVPSTEQNRILVSLETGSSILKTFWVEAKKENTTITFPASADMAPNVYVHLTMIQPHSQTQNDLPIRLYGIQSLKVTDPATMLEPIITMPNELRPEQRYTLTISEKQGKAMNYTVAVVDEGLLDITNFKTPDPWSSFFAREALGIKTWDVYDDVMGAFAGTMSNLLAVGGDGELQPKEQKEANRFIPVVKYLGPFRLEAGKKNNHSIQLPQYIGSVKTMIIAAENGAYGRADVATPVKQPLMVLATLPRVAGPGEILKLPVNIFALSDDIKDVYVSVVASGAVMLTSDKAKTVSFKGTGDQVAFFELKARDTFGVGKVEVTAKSGTTTANYSIELNIKPRNPAMVHVNKKLIAGGESWNTQYEPLGLFGENEGALEISSMPPLNLEQRLGYLIRYPHGCIEQTTSSVFAQLYLGTLVDLTPDRKDKIQKNVEAGIQRLRSFQLSNGGLAYWPGQAYASLWGTNYAGHFLVEARKKGYAVPESLLSDWVKFQTEQAEDWDNSSDANNDLTQSYRLYTLALHGKPAMGAMNRMKENNQISIRSKWRLALTYALAGYNSQALQMIDNLPTDLPANNTHYRYTFGSDTRDQAMILETLVALSKQEDAFVLLERIAEKMSDPEKWLSTQTTAYSLIAIAKYAETNKLNGSSNLEVTVGSSVTTIAGDKYVHTMRLDAPDQSAPISINNKGEQPVYIRLIRSGVPLEGNETAQSSDVTFKIDYQDMNGSPLNVSNLKQGTDLKAIVTVINPGRRGEYSDMALTQIFPSGWEIINTRLDGSAAPQTNATYMDIRDDRVMHYFDLKPNQSSKFTVLLNASYQGTYYLPAVQVEAMYDATIYANTAGKWVNVLPEK